MSAPLWRQAGFTQAGPGQCVCPDCGQQVATREALRHIDNCGGKLTAEQLQALQRYAEAAGSDWKESLCSDWLRAGSRAVDTDTYTFLHQLRNSHGPAWLFACALRGETR